MTAPRLVIAAGGTAGHMFPAQALAEVMLADGWRVDLSTDARGATYSGSFPQAVTRRVVRSATFARGGVIAKLAVPVMLAAGCISAVASMLAKRPNVVVGFGGYPAIPAMSAAWLLRIPRMVHEQNGVLGRVNQVFAKRVNRVACSVWPTKLPVRVDAVHTGNPIRQSVRDHAAAPYPSMAGRLRLIVMGGSQGASILSQVVPDGLARLPKALRDRLDVTHQGREADLAQAQTAYDTAQISAQTLRFIHDLPEQLSQAHLVISRAGASSVADIAAIGCPSVLVPLAAAIRDEQTANAAGLVGATAAVLMPEPQFTPDALAQQVERILSDPQTANAMANAALTQGMPDAVDRLKGEVLKLAGHI